MADPVDLPPSQTHWQDVSTIPTTQFQQSMLAVMYLVAAVAYLTYGLRMYSRISSKQTGLGKYESNAKFSLIRSCAKLLTTYLLFRGLADFCSYGERLLSRDVSHLVLTPDRADRSYQLPSCLSHTSVGLSPESKPPHCLIRLRRLRLQVYLCGLPCLRFAEDFRPDTRIVLDVGCRSAI